MPQRRKDTLTADQIETGRRMRELLGTSWYRIGLMLGCASEQIRYAIDTEYAERRRGAWTRNSANARERERTAIKERCAAFKPKRSVRKPQAGTDDGLPTADELEARRRATKQDTAFAEVMTQAIRAKSEICPIGVDTRPSTHDPKFVPARGNALMSVTGSHAQMCADFA